MIKLAELASKPRRELEEVSHRSILEFNCTLVTLSQSTESVKSFSQDKIVNDSSLASVIVVLRYVLISFSLLNTRSSCDTISTAVDVKYSGGIT